MDDNQWEIAKAGCVAFAEFNSSLKEWLQRFHNHRVGYKKEAGSTTYDRFEPFFVMLAEYLETDKSFIMDMLSDKDRCQTLLLEEEQDTRDRILRLYAMYERFLVKLREEVNGKLGKGDERGRFGEWLYGALPSNIKYPAQIAKLTGSPIEAILPGYDCDKESRKREDGIDDAISQLNELELWFDEERFHITNYPARSEDELVRLDWSDWHAFLYGIRNAEGHGSLRKTLNGGCFHEKRRERIRKFLNRVVENHNTAAGEKKYESKNAHYWALDMLRLLTDAEYRLWLAEGRKGEEITDPVHNEPWSKYKREVMCKHIRYASSRTEFEVSLSYSVKIWIPRMMKVLTERLLHVLICLPLICKPSSSAVTQSDHQTYDHLKRSLLAVVASDDDGTQ